MRSWLLVLEIAVTMTLLSSMVAAKPPRNSSHLLNWVLINRPLKKPWKCPLFCCWCQCIVALWTSCTASDSLHLPPSSVYWIKSLKFAVFFCKCGFIHRLFYASSGVALQWVSTWGCSQTYPPKCFELVKYGYWHWGSIVGDRKLSLSVHKWETEMFSEFAL